MEGSIPLFKLYGFQIKLHPSWLIILVLLAWTLAVGFFPQSVAGQSTATYWAMGLGGALGLFICIILHELGHAVVARRFGIPIQGISLFIFGGVAEMESEPPTARSELYMAVAGPAVSIVLAVVFWFAASLGASLGFSGPAVGVLQYLALINGILVLFNLIPAFPLDGGRVLRSILWRRQGNLRTATRTASRIGSGFGVFLIVLGVVSLLTGNFIGGMWWALIGLFLRGASKDSFCELEIRQARWKENRSEASWTAIR